MSNAIQLREEQSPLDTLVTPEWPRTIVDLVKKQSCPKGIPDGDFYVFMKKCQQTGLNPLTGEAFCVPRRTNVAPKGQKEDYVTLFQFQPAAEGMRTRAARFPDFGKVDGAAVHANDTVANIDPGTGLVEHRFNAVKPRGALVGAWGRVEKKDGTKVVVWLPAGSRNGQSSFWTQDPGSMLAKCAEVAALRKSYPVHFGGVYAREEMDVEAEPSRAQAVLTRLDGQPAAPVEDKPALPPPGPVVEFGQWKDRPVEDLSRAELQAAIAYGTEQLADPKHAKAKWRPKVEKNLEVLSMTIYALTDQEPSEEAPREPGADDGPEDPAYVAAQEAAAAEPGSAG